MTTVQFESNAPTIFRDERLVPGEQYEGLSRKDAETICEIHPQSEIVDDAADAPESDDGFDEESISEMREMDEDEQVELAKVLLDRGEYGDRRDFVNGVILSSQDDEDREYVRDSDTLIKVLEDFIDG